MKRPTAQELQQKLDQVTPLLDDSVSFEQVISWVYSAAEPVAKRFRWWERKNGKGKIQNKTEVVEKGITPKRALSS